MAENKTIPTKASVKAFIDAIEDEAQKKCCQAIAKVLQQATGYKPVMWGESIVGFGEGPYGYSSGCNGVWFFAGFSPRKGNTSIYVMPGVDCYAELIAKLGKVKLAKSCIYIKKLEDIDLEILAEIAGQCEANFTRVMGEYAEQAAAKAVAKKAKKAK